MNQLYNEHDHILLEKISRGDAQSFNELYKNHWRTVYNYAFRRLSDQGKAEDVTQEIFCKIWLNRTALAIENLQAYLYTAVRNKVLNLFEKEKRVVPFEHLLTRSFKAEQADHLALQNEFLSAYEALIAHLPEKRKTIFLQHYELGKSTEEIANHLSLSQKTVQNQIGRAVAFLKTGLSHLFTLAVIFFL